MIWPNKFRMIFRMISAIVAGIFLWNQVAWAGDLSAVPVDNPQEKSGCMQGDDLAASQLCNFSQQWTQ